MSPRRCHDDDIAAMIDAFTIIDAIIDMLITMPPWHADDDTRRRFSRRLRRRAVLRYAAPLLCCLLPLLMLSMPLRRHAAIRHCHTCHY